MCGSAYPVFSCRSCTCTFPPYCSCSEYSLKAAAGKSATAVVCTRASRCTSASSTLAPELDRTCGELNLSRLYNLYEHLILTRLFSRNACLALAIVPVLGLLSQSLACDPRISGAPV